MTKANISLIALAVALLLAAVFWFSFDSIPNVLKGSEVQESIIAAGNEAIGFWNQRAESEEINTAAQLISG